MSRYSSRILRSIPCIYLSPLPGTLLPPTRYSLLLLFHSNGEDLQSLYPLATSIQSVLPVAILCPEYPGYSLYPGSPDEDTILTDALGICTFILEELSIPLDKVLILGRSIGCGPAVHIGSLYKTGGILLISPFSSVRAVVKDKFGSIVSKCVKERFDNLSKAPKVNCPVKIVHGMLDKVVLPAHSQALASILR